tara:strand:+ start:4125 stop:4367 length:243 start_codon:yes stop_codon:yes gene_type:complete
MELIISKYAKVIAKHIKMKGKITNLNGIKMIDGEVDYEDIIELAIQIGEDNGLYDENDEENLYWNDLDRNKCFDKAHEII